MSLQLHWSLKHNIVSLILSLKASCEDNKTFASLFSCHYTLKMEVVSYLRSEATDLELSIAIAP